MIAELTRCGAICREAVLEPQNALGWEVMETFGGSLAWFCPGCAAARRVTPAAPKRGRASHS